jgi:superfamily II DNA or RNA helicase
VAATATVDGAPVPPPISVPMSTLAQRCQRQFPRAVAARGRDYFVSGRVAVTSTEGTTFGLAVQGSGVTYNVVLDYATVPGTRSLLAKCDCPFYDGGVLCKHVWAAVLQIDKAGLAEKVPESGPLRVMHVKPRPRREDREQRRPAAPHVLPRYPAGGTPRPVDPANWSERLDQIKDFGGVPFSGTAQAFFVINAAETASVGRLVIDLWSRERLTSGDLGPLKPKRVQGHEIVRFADSRDRDALSLLTRTSPPKTFSPFSQYTKEVASRFAVDPILESNLLPMIAGAGRFLLSRSPNGSPDDADRPLRMDRGKTWDLELKIENASPANYRLTGFLRREGELRGLLEPICVFRSGYVLFADRLSRLTDPRHVAWYFGVRGPHEILVPREQGDALLKRLLTDPTAPRLNFPDDMGWTSQVIEPKPRGVFRPLGNDPSTGRMTLTVSFIYADREVGLDDNSTTLVDLDRKRVLSRNVAFEDQTLRQALEILRDTQGTGTLPVSDLHRAATELAQAGWTVYVENQQLRTADDFAMNVSSGTDWFDLTLSASFGDSAIRQPELLAALERKEGMIRLPDGSLGMLPQEWLAKFTSLGSFGEKTEDGGLRFKKSQGMMLNAVLTEAGGLRADPTFAAFREKVRKFEGVKLARAPEGFQGKLRDYQKQGLSWLQFLDEFEMGGVLADDMGLGKTIQILAFLQARKTQQTLPSIVVAPKSLTFNWADEAARFVPGMRVIRYAGDGRTKRLKDARAGDLIVTTYGTLRTDIEKIRDMEFDVAIVDEAQAIKNRESQSSQAVKLLKAKHRLALTGTPIENSITDLFSILEFTSPGLLGFSQQQQKELSQDTRAMLGHMVKPFLLRRTKEKVLEELPEKSEQVLFCEMSTEEKKLYSELRDHYRASLTGQIEKGGLGKAKLHVLEALLRLRQAACHPGLVNPEKKGEPSAKLQLLVNQVHEVVQEGHKALVFSQFTSLLDLVKASMDAEGIVYEYLDGQTVDRKRPVERFQTDPKCPVFLISLKAGGVGLNLTAADYVFILDPWWNPAVEAQAIDRAHRIGQKQKVFAYRMIAKDTVEEKILELQASKRELAESLISEDKDIMRKLTREDLELLLG